MQSGMRGFPASEGLPANTASRWVRDEPGTYQWQKPPVSDPASFFVVLRGWGAGGAGGGGTGNNGGNGGNGGGFFERCFRYEDVPASLACSVGAGGASVSTNIDGNDGGDTQISGGEIFLFAPGGAGGQNASGTQPDPTGPLLSSSYRASDYSPFLGGKGGDGAEYPSIPDGLPGGGACWGGAGGGGSYGGSVSSDAGVGGESIYGGNGGSGHDATGPTPATDGQSPGGGGGGAIFSNASGAGAPGRIEIIVTKTPAFGPFSNVFEV